MSAILIRIRAPGQGYELQNGLAASRAARLGSIPISRYQREGKSCVPPSWLRVFREPVERICHIGSDQCVRGVWRCDDSTGFVVWTVITGISTGCCCVRLIVGP
jgi:hypothetical protein